MINEDILPKSEIVIILIPLIVLIICCYYLVIRNMNGKRIDLINKFNEINGIVSFIFLLILFFSGSVAYRFYLTLFKGFYDNPLLIDIKKVIYETRTILGYAEGIIVATIAFFVPILIFGWNDTINTINSEQIGLIELLKEIPWHNNRKKIIIGNGLKKLEESRKELDNIGNLIRGPFYLFIIIIVIIILLLIWANCSMEMGIKAYLWVAILRIIALDCLIFCIFMLGTFLIWVIPIKRKNIYLDIKKELYL